jgi:8-oxo-dGTP pyrophosphatase MutT (NUDIX family)
VITLEPNYERALGSRPSVSAVIFDRHGHLLLEPRSDGGQWGLPGGSMEIGESVTLALDSFPVRRLPLGLLSNHRIRVRDACARRVAPFVR